MRDVQIFLFHLIVFRFRLPNIRWCRAALCRLFFWVSHAFVVVAQFSCSGSYTTDRFPCTQSTQKRTHTHALLSRTRSHTLEYSYFVSRRSPSKSTFAIHLAGFYPFAVSFLVASVRYSFIQNVTFHIYGYGGTHLLRRRYKWPGCRTL